MSVYVGLWLLTLLLMLVGAICSVVFFRRGSKRHLKQEDLDSILFETKAK